MQIIIILEILVIFLVTLSLLEHYCSKTVQLYVKILVFIPWFCTFLNIVLVPLDVFYTLKRKEDPAQYKDSYDTMVTIWEVVYWTSFVFTWLILPVLQEYVDAGDFTPKERIAKSIKINLIIYGAMAGLGVLFVGYLALSGKAGFQSIMEFCITFGNCFGIFLIVICLGFGLVHIPKRHFQQVDKEVNLRYYHYQISTVEEQKSNLQFDLEELIKLIHLLSKRKDILVQEKRLLSQILQDVPEKMVKEIENTVSETNHIIAKEYGSLNLSKIVSLNKQVKKKVNELRRIENKWEMTLQHAFFLEDVIESKHSIDWRIRSVFYIERKGKCGRFLDTLEWIWHVKLEQVFYFITGTFFICISIGVFFAETLTFDNHHFLTLDSFLQAGDSFAKSQFVCLIPLCYLSFCVYSALFNMKLAGLYGLYPHQQTDASSLVFSALNFSRVSSPLVFNFLQMMKLQGTAFNIVMGDVNLAYSFTKYFPLILIFLILCNAFEIYGRILGWIGLSSYEFSEELSDEKIEEGKKLLYRARNNKERNFLTLNSTNLRNYQTYATRGKISDYYTFDIESTRVTRGTGSANFSTQSSFTKSEKSPFKSSEKSAKPLMRGKQNA